MSHLSKAVILGLVTGVTGMLLSLFHFAGDIEEGMGLHILFKLRGQRKPPGEVLIISMDRTSADELNLPEDPRKWTRTLHARLTERLHEEGASVIAYDIIFEDGHSAREDGTFADAIRKAGNVVLCKVLKSDRVLVSDSENQNAAELAIIKFVYPVPVLEKAAFALASFPLPKVPVKLSRYWTFKKEAGDIPTLPVVAYQVYSMQAYDEFIRLMGKTNPQYAFKLPSDVNRGIKGKGVEKFIQELRDLFENDDTLAEKMLTELEKNETLSVDAGKKRILGSLITLYQGTNSPYLNFYGPPGSITTIPYYKALNTLPANIRGKAVFIGLSELFRPEQKDGFHTVFSGPSGVDISGVEIAATAFANILEDKPIRPIPFTGHIVILFLWGTAIGVMCFFFPAFYAVTGTAGLSLVYLSFAEYQFKTAGLWYPVMIPIFLQTTAPFFSAVLWKYIESNRERQSIKKAFEYYLPDDVVNRLVENLGNVKAGGQTVNGICLYTDAKQYTAFAEQMEPEELGDFMNKYYAALFEPVRRHGGVVSNVIGDSMLALWVTSRPETSAERMACLCALDIARAINAFNQSSEKMKLPTRICLHSGRLFMGNIGAEDHYEYRPIGDIVNTTTRIEGLNRFLGTRILVSQNVIWKLKSFLTRNLGTFLLAGKSKPVVVHELISTLDESNDGQKKACAIFSEALELFGKREWIGSLEKFREYAIIMGKDEPAEFYISLCEAYKKSPPEELWSGEIRVEKQ